MLSVRVHAGCIECITFFSCILIVFSLYINIVDQYCSYDSLSLGAEIA